MAENDDRGWWGRTWLAPTVLGAALLALLSGYGQFGITTVLGDVAESFGESGGDAAGAGLPTSTLGWGLAVIRLAGLAALPAASLADRRGRRSVLWLCGAGLALTVVAATMPSFWTFVLVVALARPLLAATNAVATTVAAEATATAGRTKALAVTEVGYSLGAGLVALVHAVGSETLGFRGVLGLAAILGLAFPWLSRRVRESRLFERLVSLPDPRLAPARKRLGHVSADMRSRLVLVSVLAALVALVTGPGFTFLFVYGENVLGVSPAFMGGLILAAGASGLPGLLVGRWLADRLGRRITAGGTTVLLAIAMWVTYSGGVTAMAGGYLAAVSLAGAFGPAGAALFAEVFPTRDRSTAAGWATAAGVVGAVAGLALFGVLVDQLGGYAVAGAVLWLPLTPLVALYRALPETRHRELEELDDATRD